MKTTFIASFKKVIVLSAIFSLAAFASYATAAWTEPQGLPPANAPAPINVSSETQTKFGNFLAKGLSAEVICLGPSGGDCRSAWPSGGGGASARVLSGWPNMIMCASETTTNKVFLDIAFVGQQYDGTVTYISHTMSDGSHIAILFNADGSFREIKNEGTNGDRLKEAMNSCRKSISSIPGI